MTDIQISKTAAKREARIAEILDCAEVQFVESGFHGAGISGIAKSCGISVGHLYHYFSSKEALIEAVVERELVRQRDKLEDFRNLNAAEIRDQIAPLVIDAIVKSQEPFRTVLNFEILAEAQRNPSIAAKFGRSFALFSKRPVLGRPSCEPKCSLACLREFPPAICAIRSRSAPNSLS